MAPGYNKVRIDNYFNNFKLYKTGKTFFIQVRMSWKLGENKNLFLKGQSKCGLHIVLKTPKTFPRKWH